MNTGTLIAVLGIGAAAFLYWRSQQAQAAALAAAQGASGPGLVQKFGNTVKTAVKGAPDAAKAAFKLPLKGATSITQGFGRVTGGITSTIRGIF